MEVNPARDDERKSQPNENGRSRGYVSEVFCSVQGEGLFLAEPQVFYRTAGCSQSCSWCDTLYSKVETPRCVIRGRGGSVVRTLRNPLSVETGVREVLSLSAQYPRARTVSITGGEPLEQAEFVTETAARIKREGMAVYLETAGIHDHAFEDILPYVDVVAMDIKLPSATETETWNEHSAFLSRIDGTAFDPRAASRNGGGKTIFVKIVVDGKSRLDEIESAARLIASSSNRIPLILQPESGVYLSDRSNRDDVKVLNEALAGFRETAARVLRDVRVVPQLHKILNVR